MENEYTKFDNKFTTLLKETNNIIKDSNVFKNRNYVKTDGIIEIKELIVDELDCDNFLYTGEIVFKDEQGNDTGSIKSKPASVLEFNTHIVNKANPHNATREWFIVPTDDTSEYAHEGFVKMDNTPDLEKCLSDTMREKIDKTLDYKKTLYYDRLDVMEGNNDTSMLTGKGIYEYAYGEFQKKILDKAYPVGTVYSSNIDKNPTEYFGGIWIKLESGYILIDSDNDVGGEKGGDATYTLKESDIPPHSHPLTVTSVGQHEHGRGNMNIWGTVSNNNMGEYSGGYNPGVIHTDGGPTNGGKNSTSGTSPRYRLSAASGWNSSLQSSSAGAHSHKVLSVSSAGSTSPSAFSLIQPYIASYMWKRAA